MLKKKWKKQVTFQVPEGYALEDSPLPSTSRLQSASHLPTICSATTTAQPNAPVKRAFPPRAAQSVAAAASDRHRARTSIGLPPLPPLVRKPEGQAGAVIPPLPPSTPHPALNHLLLRNALSYNLLFEPNVATADGWPLTEYQRQQPATNPAVRRLVIIFDWSRSRPPVGFPKRMIEVVSRDSPASPVALVDVLDAVHEWLHQPIEQDAWASTSPEQQLKTSTAFWKRVHRARLPGEQEARGVLKIDYLGDRTYFGGVRPLAHQPESWLLDLQRLA